MPLVIYSALRLGLFAALTLLMHFWAGMEWWFAALISVFAAWGLSYTMLDGPRDAAARYLADRAEARKERNCLLYTSPSPRDGLLSRMPSSA